MHAFYTNTFLTWNTPYVTFKTIQKDKPNWSDDHMCASGTTTFHSCQTSEWKLNKGLWLDELLTVETRATCQSSRCHSQRISGETTANNMISIASTIYTHSTSATKCVNSKNTVCRLMNYRDAVFLHWHYPWWQKSIYGSVQSRCSLQPPPRCSILILFGLQK